MPKRSWDSIVKISSASSSKGCYPTHQAQREAQTRYGRLQSTYAIKELFGLLCSFLSLTDLNHLSCNKHFLRMCTPANVMRRQWTSDVLLDWPADKLSYVRKLSVTRNEPLVQGVLPAGLKKLTLGLEFDQAFMEGVQPAGLEILNLSATSTSHWTRVCCQPDWKS